MAVYFLQHPETKYIKIGKAKDLKRRLQQVCQLNGCQLAVLGIVDGYTNKERQLHKPFDKERVYKEPPYHNLEWFYPSNRLVDYIEQNSRPVKIDYKYTGPHKPGSHKAILITYNGKTQTVARWSKELGIVYSTLRYRIRNGRPVEKALEAAGIESE